MDIILGSFIGTVITYLVFSLYIKFVVQPEFAEYGRMSQLLRKGWCFHLTDYGVTHVYDVVKQRYLSNYHAVKRIG